MIKAFLNYGLLFDISISCYILLLPYIIVSIRNITGYWNSCLHRFLNIYFSILLIIVLALLIADLPFFSFYNSRITNSILSWTDDLSLMFKALLFYRDFYLYIVLFLIISVASLLFVIKINFYLLKDFIPSKTGLVYNIILTMTTGSLMFLGIRGDLNFKSKPLITEDAFFCDYSFINQLAINPVFNFIDSYRAFDIKYYDQQSALNNVRYYLKVKDNLQSPVARKIYFNEPACKANIVIVLMESMSANKMGCFGNDKGLTPFLDSLYRVSLSFNNFYTAGIHTYNAIFSTLCSLPALMKDKPTVESKSAGKTFDGISSILAKKGYYNMFFCTGDKRFDNMGAFLKTNNFHQIISEIDYPANKIINGWGVADHTMLNFAIPVLNNQSKKNQPFLAVILTITAHEGAEISEAIDYKPKTTNKTDQLYEYSDWALKNFFNKAKQQEWFDNTIFVFLADHGQNFDPLYEMPLSYHHSPLIIYSSKYIRPAINNNFALQMDVFPTLMGIMKLEYINNTLGIDLLKDKRPYAYFSADNKIGCLDDKYYLIIRKDKSSSLYKYKEKNIADCYNNNKQTTDSMKKYVFSMLQSSKWLIEN
ncbi:MAG: LTA synthase family protein [Bacteroidales bacterium]|nr:LTA synthase family protein [Bacteroidales bacterium]